MVAHWVLDPLGTGTHLCCAAEAPGFALWVPDPLRALAVPLDASGTPVDPLGVGDPPCGVTQSRWHRDILLCTVAVQGHTGLGGGGHWVGGGGHWVGGGALGWGGGHWVGGGGTWAPLGGLLMLVFCGLGCPCCPLPPHGWSAPDGLLLMLRKQPIWAAGDTPHLMPVEQVPWHPVATGLARPSPVLLLPPMRTLPPPPLPGARFPLSLLPPLPCCPSLPCPLHSPLSLRVWLPCPVWLCCPSPFPSAFPGGACALLLLPHPSVPPHKDFASAHGVYCPARGGLVTALLPPPWRAAPCARGAAPDLAEFAGTSWGEGGAWLPMARSASAAFGGCCRDPPALGPLPLHRAHILKERGGGGVWNPNVCVLKTAQIKVSFGRYFVAMKSGSKGGDTPSIPWLSAVRIHPCPCTPPPHASLGRVSRGFAGVGLVNTDIQGPVLVAALLPAQAPRRRWALELVPANHPRGSVSLLPLRRFSLRVGGKWGRTEGRGRREGGREGGSGVDVGVAHVAVRKPPAQGPFAWLRCVGVVPGATHKMMVHPKTRHHETLTTL